MKYKLLTIIAVSFLLTTTKAKAFENVISLGAGARYIQQNITVYGTIIGANYNAGTIGVTNYSIEISNKVMAPEVNLEYQARFDSIGLGLGVSAAIKDFKSTYQNPLIESNEAFEATSTFIDIYPVLLFNLVKANQFSLSVGVAAALGGVNIAAKKDMGITLDDQDLNLGYVQARLIADGEINLENNTAIFARGIIAPKALILMAEQEETRSKTIVLPNGTIGMLSVRQTIKPKFANIAITFGVRYKF